MSRCPSEDELAALAEERLPSDRATRVQRHVDECPRCLARVGRAPEAGLSSTLEAGAAPSSAWEPPAEFDGFQRVRPLDRGAMGQVYLAYDPRLDRTVALKFIAADNAHPGSLQRFRVEARAMA